MDVLLFLYFIKKDSILFLRNLVTVVLRHFFLVQVSIFDAHFVIGSSILRRHDKVLVIISEGQPLFCGSQRYFAILKLLVFEKIALNIKLQFALLRIYQLVALIFGNVEEFDFVAGSMCRRIGFEIIVIDDNIVYFTLDFLLL